MGGSIGLGVRRLGGWGLGRGGQSNEDRGHQEAVCRSGWI